MRALPTIGYFCLALAWLVGCGDVTGDPDGGYDPDGDLYPPDFQDSGDQYDRPCGPADGGSDGSGDGCSQAGFDCSLDPCLHGRCVDTAGGPDWCECDPGYAGERCDGCADGYVALGLSCVPAGGCQDSPCVHGTCRPEGGEEFSCDCHAGYVGRLCDRCAEGYHVEELRCVPD